MFPGQLLASGGGGGGGGLTLTMGCSYSRICPCITCIVLQGSQGAVRNSVDNCFLVGNVIVSGLQALQTEDNGFISLCSTKKLYFLQ